MGEFQTVKLPVAVVQRIDAHRAADPRFRSRGELVKHAVLDYLERRPVA